MVVAIILRAAVSVGLDKDDLPIVVMTIDAEVSIGVTTAVAESAVATTDVAETSDDPNTAGV